MGFPGGASGKESPYQCRRFKRCRFDLGQPDPLEKEMATHSSILAWKIPQAEEPGRLQSMGPQRVRHNSTEHSTAANMFSKMAGYRINMKITCIIADDNRCLVRMWRYWNPHTADEDVKCCTPLGKHYQANSTARHIPEGTVNVATQELTRKCW